MATQWYGALPSTGATPHPAMEVRAPRKGSTSPLRAEAHALRMFAAAWRGSGARFEMEAKKHLERDFIAKAKAKP